MFSKTFERQNSSVKYEMMKQLQNVREDSLAVRVVVILDSLHLLWFGLLVAIWYLIYVVVSLLRFVLHVIEQITELGKSQTLSL